MSSYRYFTIVFFCYRQWILDICWHFSDSLFFRSQTYVQCNTHVHTIIIVNMDPHGGGGGGGGGDTYPDFSLKPILRITLSIGMHYFNYVFVYMLLAYYLEKERILLPHSPHTQHLLALRLHLTLQKSKVCSEYNIIQWYILSYLNVWQSVYSFLTQASLKVDMCMYTCTVDLEIFV